MSLTSELTDLQTKAAQAEAALSSLEADIRAKQAAIEAATAHSALWDRVKSAVESIQSGATTELSDVADHLSAIESDARALLNL